MIPLSKDERYFLSYLAINGSSIAHHITALSTFQRSQVPRKLESMGLVSHSSAFQTHPAFQWNFTTYGFAIAISELVSRERQLEEIKRIGYSEEISLDEKRRFIEKTYQKLSRPIDPDVIQAVEKWRGKLLPLVLGKWHIFKEKEVENIAHLNLIPASGSIIEELQKDWVFEDTHELSTISTSYILNNPNIQQERLTKFFYQLNLLHGRDTKWIYACKTDPVLKEYLTNRIQYLLNGNVEQIKTLRQKKRILIS